MIVTANNTRHVKNIAAETRRSARLHDVRCLGTRGKLPKQPVSEPFSQTTIAQAFLTQPDGDAIPVHRNRQ